MVNDIEIPTDLNNREPLYVHFNSYKKIGINQIFNICALLEKSKSLKRKRYLKILTDLNSTFIDKELVKIGENNFAGWNGFN